MSAMALIFPVVVSLCAGPLAVRDAAKTLLRAMDQPRDPQHLFIFLPLPQGHGAFRFRPFPRAF